MPFREWHRVSPDLGLRRHLPWRFLTGRRKDGDKLRDMQQSGQVQPSPASRSFAGLLASLAAPRTEAADAIPAWNDRDLGEDVATLSYESALRTHARYRPVERGDWVETKAADPPSSGTSRATREEKAGEGIATNASRAIPAGNDGDLRRASVTIRLSQAEMEQLRRRATEAGLTISAYLRSCTFEAEALRAQVKEALAELRRAGTEETEETGNKGTREQRNKEPLRRKCSGWFARFVARRRREPRAAEGISLPAVPGT